MYQTYDLIRILVHGRVLERYSVSIHAAFGRERAGKCANLFQAVEAVAACKRTSKLLEHIPLATYRTRGVRLQKPLYRIRFQCGYGFVELRGNSHIQSDFF